MSEKIKVLQLLPYCNDNISSLAEQIVRGLPEDRFEVTSAFLSGRPGPRDAVSRARHSIYFDCKKTSLKGFKRIWVLWRLYLHLRNEQYEVVIAHRHKPVSMLMLLNNVMKITACIGVHHGFGDFDRFFRRLETRCLLRRNWKSVGVSRAVCTYLVNAGAGFVPQNTVQINNAIDIELAVKTQLPPDLARAELGLDPEAIVLGCIGRLVPVKGHIYLIEALARLRKNFPGVQLAIIGEGRSRQQLERAVEKYGLHKRVHLLGARENAVQYVRAFNALVMPSLNEGLPLALLEGMCGRLPVVGSNIDSLQPILEECGGRIFEVANVDSLTEALEGLLMESAEQRRLAGERAYAYLCDHHDIQGFRQKYRALLEEMLVSGGRA